ncbi:MAG: 50S ribosomal protein L44e [Promethearchaeota archaeon]
MKMPKKIRTYCPKCNKHQVFTVSIYKKGKDRKMAEGKRRYDRKKKGYGSQPKEIFRKNAKINKKVLPMYKCSVCGYVKRGKAKRVKRIEIVNV